MRDMGQSTPNLYKRVYAHMFPEVRQEMYAALADHADNLLEKKVKQKVKRKAANR